ncbi:MAG: thioredoxin family protein [Microscillaceae bacterium]
MASQTQALITAAHLEKALTYAEYRQLVDELLAQNRATGDFMNNTEDILHYSKMNVQRMSRWDKTLQLAEETIEALHQVKTPMTWLVLTEGWCGDAAQNIPVLVKMADQSPLVEIKFLLRDENLDIMDAYLTNGGRGIPKMIVLQSETLEELAQWGPRPEGAQALVNAHKQNPETDYKTFVEKLHKWYADNKTVQIQAEIRTLLKGL